MMSALQNLPIPLLLLIATTLEVSGDSRTLPGLPLMVGGILVIAGGLIITFRRPTRGALPDGPVEPHAAVSDR
jgi:hypothetical protein